jgi:uncharacterized protein (TIGR03435 family)
MGFLPVSDLLARTACFTLALASFLGAQPLQFEVATIRAAAPVTGVDGSGRERVDVTPTSVTIRNASLSFLIQWAYDVQFYQVSGPGWLNEQRYDVQSKPAVSASEKDLRLMMRALLAERFRLTLHTEQRPRAVYFLVTREAPKLEVASAMETHSFGVAGGDFVFRGTSMTEFADQLSDFATVDRPVIDKTGLAGRFNFTLDSAARAIRGGEGPSIFTAVSELGLQMRPVDESVEVLVVEGAERNPSEN